MKAFDRAFASVRSVLIIVEIALIGPQFGCNASCKCWTRTPILRQQVSVGGRRWYRQIEHWYGKFPQAVNSSNAAN